MAVFNCELVILLVVIVGSQCCAGGSIHYQLKTIADHEPQRTEGRGSALDAVPRVQLQRQLDFLSCLAPLPCRDDFAAAAQAHFYVTGRAAEVGVYRIPT